MSLRIFSSFSEKLLKRNLDSENFHFVVNYYNIRIKFAAILIAALLAFSCGGGGGGGGMVAFAPTEGGAATPHNGGDAGGWGTGNSTGNGFNPQGQSIEESESGPLFSQMAALDVSTVDIRLNINNVEQPLIVANETTPKSVLPKIKPGTKVHGSAVIHLQDGTARTAYLDETEAALHGVLKFKVPYNFKAYDLSGTLVKEDTYFARDGINLAAQTVDPIAGWHCVEDDTVHYGSYVTGVRGDITLNAVLGNGAPVLTATASQNVLYARATSSDTTTITITNVTGSITVTPSSSEIYNDPATPDATDPSKYTVAIHISGGSNPVWFSDNTAASVTITDDSGATTSVPLTLKNKYSLEAGLSYTDSFGNTNIDSFVSSTEFNAGDTLDYSTIALSAPAGRQIVAYSYTHPTTSTTTIYKTTTTPQDTFSFSSALGRRNVYLSAVLDFTCSLSDGGYGTTASPLNSQTGTSTNPYLLNYYGNDTNKRNQIELEISDNNCADSALTIGSTQTAIFNATFDITHTGNKFLIKIKPTLAESAVYTSNTIKLTITDPTTGAKKDIHVLLKMVRIGSKPAPDAVGDIVFNDGSAMPYSEFTALDTAVQNEKKVDAIALIFYKGNSTDALGARTLGVGLKHYKYGHAWCPSSAAAYNKNIDTIQCIPSGSAGAYTFSGDKDGSDNLSQIATFLENNASTNDTGTAANYRAFYFAKNYASQTVTNIDPASEYASYWYLPSIAELFQIYANGKGANKIFDIDAASNALGGDSFGTSSYWSSSQSAAGDVYAYDLSFNDGNYTGYNKTQDNDVCAIRAF